MATMKTKTKNVEGEGGKAAKLAAENARLRAENERLKTDREILKKALGLFSKSD
jgi:transposase